MSMRLGPFSLGAVLGRGGMGAVWAGEHTDGDPVAVKVITRARARDDLFQQAFRHEVRAMAGLQHRHICGVYDFGTISAPEAGSSGGRLVAGSPWLAMERASGSLERWVGRCQWPDLKRVLLQVLDGLAHAHARGVIHRDIKPANVLLVDGQARLADFGIAHLGAGVEAGGGESGSQGTPAFMAPEQLAGRWRDFGPGTDLFALGATAWLLACGRLPFPSNRLVLLELGRPVAPLPFLPAAPVPAALVPWLRRLLHPDPAQRYPSAAHAAWALARLETEAMLQPDAGAGPPPEPGGGSTLGWSPGGDEGGDSTAAWEPGGAGTLAWHTAGGARASELSLQTLALRAYQVAPTPPVGAGELAPLGGAPPLPDSWRRSTPPPSLRLSGVGLGLYGLRAVGLVGREAERDALWGALRAVCGGEGPRAVALTGAAGVGKSRLARWLLHRGLECGAVETLEATWSQPAAASDGLLAALERHLRLRGLDRPQVAERLRALLGVEDRELGALTELLRPLEKGAATEGVPSVTLETPASRREALVSGLLRLCASQPLVLWLDDIQWSEGGLEVVGELLERDPSPPILVLLTAREEALADAPVQAAALAALAGHPRVQRLAVAPLDGERRVALVEELLGLSGPLAEQVAERTGGNPLFATQLVGDWVSRGVLVVRGGAFVVAEGAAVDIPDAIHDLWTGRLDRVLQDQPAAAREALELAALLGVEVDDAEWREVCERADVHLPGGLRDALEQQGLALHREGGWAFVHGMLTESVTRIAGEAGRLAGERRAAGAVLFQRGQDAHAHSSNLAAEKALARAERLLQEAGPTPGWVEATRCLASVRVTLGLNDAALLGLSRALDAARSLGDRAEEARALHQLGLLRWHLGQSEPSRAGFERALAIFQELGDRHGEGAALRELANLDKYQGRPEQALETYRRACEIYRGLGDRAAEGHTIWGMAGIYLFRGQYEPAREHYERALVLQEEAGHRQNYGVTLASLGDVALYQRRFDDARAYYDRAMVIHRETGNQRGLGLVLTNLGIMSKDLGQIDQALSYYEQALAMWLEMENPRGELSVRGNLGLLHMQEGRFEPSRENFERCLEIARALGDRYFEAVGTGNLGLLMTRFERLDEAREHLGAAVAACREQNLVLAAGHFGGTLAHVLGRSGELAQAREMLTQSEALLRESGSQQHLGMLYCRACAVERMAGEREAARAHLQRAEHIAAQISSAPDSPLGQALAAERAAG
jgi:tetratricopeptide (TPR) repeat protein